MKRFCMFLTCNFAEKCKMNCGVVIIVSNNAVAGGSNHIVVNQQPSDFDDAVIMQPAAYKKIFGKKKYARKGIFNHDIVKITYKGQSVHRRIELGTYKGLTLDICAMTYKTLGELSWYDKDNDVVVRPNPGEEEVHVSKGCAFKYYMHHPNSATRMSFVMGFVSIVIGVFSLILSLDCIMRKLINF